jgi:hypothetical protein
MTMAGFTAIGIVVLAALAYSIRISLDPAAGSVVLTWTFLLANIIGWALGALLRSRNEDSLLGFLLVLLGDAIFPLNLYAPLILYAPQLRGDVPMTATTVILIGIAYHLWNYRHRERMRFALPFYPFFFALAGGAVLVLLRFTAGLPWWVVGWIVLAFAAAFNELTLRRRPVPPQHFGYASAVLLLGAVIVSAAAMRVAGTALLAAVVAGTAILIANAFRRAEPFSGCAAWLGLTTTFTALLYYFHSPLWLYVVMTGAWTVVLCLVSMQQPRDWSEPFHESAWWTAVVLAIALTAVLARVWLPWLVRTAVPASQLRRAAAIGLAELGIALAMVSAWRRRYPPIAATLRGFVTNNALLRTTSYAAPVLLLLAITGAWSLLGGPEPANVYAPLIAGTLLLIFGPRLERLYPAEALDCAGIVAMVCASFNALASVVLSACVLFAAALIFLARWLRGAGVWTYGAFLVLATAGAVLLPGTTRGVALAGLAALLAVILPWIRRTPPVVTWTNYWAIALAVAGFFLMPLGAAPTTIAFLVLAVALMRGSDLALRDWTAHAAGLLFWLSLARFYGFGRGWEPLVGASWAWIVFLSRTRRWKHAVLAIAALSVVSMMLKSSGAQVSIVALLLLAALLLEIRPFRHAGFLLLAAAVAVAANGSDLTWIVGTLAATAAILLWESLTKHSTFAHLFFIAAAAAAAYLAMPGSGAMRVLPIAVLLTVVLLVELALLQLREPSTVRGDLTASVALVLAIGIVAVEVMSARYSIYVLGLVFLAVVVIRPLLPPPALRKVYRLQPMVQRAFLIVAPLAGAAVVVAVARMAGLSAGQQLFAVACCSWLVLLLPRTRMAFHFLALAVYVAAALLRNGDPFIVYACLAAAAGYIAWRIVRADELLEHCAAVGIIEAVTLWGLAHRVTWPEYYLFPVAAYLCLTLLRRRPARVANTLAVLIILMAIGYPLFALLRSGQDEHTVFLGLASIIVIHVLLTSERNRWLVGAVCAMLGFGMLYSVAALRGDVILNLLMALIGFVVIADIGLLQQRHPMREIDYDHHGVAR